LETMREILRRFGWTKADTDDNGRETYFPPDRLPASGITLDWRRGGTWARIDPADQSELVETSPDKLAAYLELCSLTSISNRRHSSKLVRPYHNSTLPVDKLSALLGWFLQLIHCPLLCYALGCWLLPWMRCKSLDEVGVLLTGS
jgi:hypothetical protein